MAGSCVAVLVCGQSAGGSESHGQESQAFSHLKCTRGPDS